MSCLLSVVLCIRNPDATRLLRVLQALMVQTLDHESWELLVIDNASHPPVELPFSPEDQAKFRVIRQEKPGVRYARRTGIAESRGEFIVLVDDDNLLSPDYLQNTVHAFSRLPRVGALGGQSKPELEMPIFEWQKEFFPLLNVRNLGDEEQYYLPPSNPKELSTYPTCAPIGGGTALRRAALAEWENVSSRAPFDATVPDFTTDAETELVLGVLRAGWAVAYIPSLLVSIVIPQRKLDPEFLGGLNHRRQKAWMEVLSLYDVNPLPEIPPWAVRTQKASAFFELRAWTTPAAQIRWRGVCGHLEGRRAKE